MIGKHENKTPLRLCIIVTNAISLRYLYRNQFAYLASKNISITAIASPSADTQHLKHEPIELVDVNICREPSPIKDLVSLSKLWFFLLRNRCDIVHVSTPKAGLLGSLAAGLSLHRNLVYTLRGRVYENMKGPKRRIFEFCEW